ncbi:methyltransferase [Agaricicola taiwanensis]|uniref:Methyltransferase n=1 Tax=Agaricicola taiwanensis TaxID=591372 RepID=A0A8J3E0L2_9RHOB|nr:methyltransferase domain-containing protein [Agaricicola taiwanensis]GGE54191.1 methyltransferase [Agaricicola taiwanensis]
MTRLPSLVLAGALSALTLQVALAQQEQPAATTESYNPVSGQAGKDVVWVPTQQNLVDRMLDMAKVTKDDKVVDLGSGDGRTVITAAKRGARAHGIEYNPDMVGLARRNAEQEGVSDRATFEQGDIFEKDFSDADVVTLFLLTQLNVKLRPTLLEMEPGTRVVSNTFTMEDWVPDETVDAGADCTSFCRAYKWIIPAKVEGSWRLDGGELKLAQTYQMLSGTLSRDGTAHEISDAKMNGREISFMANGQRYVGEVQENRISGTIEGGSAWEAERAI